jgi:NIMA (never in mitosis gene a)-related kinase
MASLNDRDKMNALNEIRILASVDHQNVIGYKDAFFEDGSSTLNMVMEYADSGDLYQKITDH